MMRAMRRSSVVPAVAIAAALMLAGLWHRAGRGGDAPRYASYTAEIMASPITVTAPEPVAREAADVVFAIFRGVDATMSEWKPTSPLSAVNEGVGSGGTGTATPVPAEHSAGEREQAELVSHILNLN